MKLSQAKYFSQLTIFSNNLSDPHVAHKDPHVDHSDPHMDQYDPHVDQYDPHTAQNWTKSTIKK